MPSLEHSTNVAARMGRWSARRRKTAIFGWIAFVVAAAVLGAALGTKTLDPADNAVGESNRAHEILEAGGFADTADESVLVTSDVHTAGDPAFRGVLTDVARAVAAREGVSAVQPPLVSEDGHAAVVRYELADADGQAVSRVEPVLDSLAAVQDRHGGFRVEPFGDASAQLALDETIGADFTRAEYTAVPVTLGILVVVFGALVAAGVPLLVGLSAVLAAIGLLALPSGLFAMDEAASSVILLIGLAVSVDYSLFYLRREREERAAGKGEQAALAAAAATSGRAILISGLTVIAAVAGMFFGGSAIWTSVAIGTILVVAIAVVGSLTVLPATLGWLGDRVEKGRLPLLSRRNAGADSRVWGGIVGRVLRRPALSAALAGGLLAALAVPTFFMRTADSGIDALPRSLEIVQTYERIQAAFPGGPLPALVAIEAPDVAAPEVRDGIARLRAEAVATGTMAEPITVRASADGRVALVSVPLAGSGTDEASVRALAALRDEVIPATVGRLAGVEVAVTGPTAVSEDFASLMNERMPLAMGFVLVLAFVLLLVAFRSIVMAAKAVLLNLLSVGAAYGLLVAVFQWGWGERLLGFESTGAIVSGLPLFLFVVLFGLSMDYHVFILSRIREAYDGGMSTEAAVAHGIRTTAGTVSAAAFVMVAVFSIFVTLSASDLKQFGFGLAAAILIDATIVRAVLLPATMKLLGRWNWYLPSWLGWLPRLSDGGATAAEAV
ncbi:MAG TPA: MMPL family transporter [Gaiellaceae bacterium]|nr:MMPL family transporter [Gaiellaceae bacterium]